MVENPGRRRFLEGMCAAFGALVTAALAVPAIAYVLSPLRLKASNDWVSVCLLDDIPVGQPHRVTFRYRRQDGWREITDKATVYVVRTKFNNYSVIHSRCTHLACNVRHDKNAAVFRCPCHGGVFAEDGSVLEGPPPAPLRRLDHRQNDDQLQVRGVIG